MSNARSLFRNSIAACAGATVALLLVGLTAAPQADARRPNALNTCRQNVRHYKAELHRVERELASYQSAFQILHNGLDRIERLNEAPSRKTRVKIRRAIRKTRRSADRFVASAPAQPAPTPSQDPYAEPPPEPQVQPMSRRAFKRLRGAMRRASFDSDRTTLAADAARHNAFTVNQVIALLKTCGFEDTKIEIAVLLYPATIDTENWHRVYDVFSFSDSRQKLHKRLRGR